MTEQENSMSTSALEAEKEVEAGTESKETSTEAETTEHSDGAPQQEPVPQA